MCGFFSLLDCSRDHRITFFSMKTQLFKQKPMSLGRLRCLRRQPSNSWRPYGATVSIRLTTLTGLPVISQLRSHFPAVIFPSLLSRVLLSSSCSWIMFVHVVVFRLVLSESEYIYIFIF